MSIKVKLLSKTAKVPIYVDQYSAACNLYCNEPFPISIPYLRQEIIGTGIIIELPEQLCAQILPHNNLTTRNNINIQHTLINPGYGGEIKVIIRNFGYSTVTIKPGDCIAQLLIHPFVKDEFEVISHSLDPQQDTGEVNEEKPSGNSLNKVDSFESVFCQY